MQSHLHEEVIQYMVGHLEKITHTQANSREWFKYQAGQITASHVKQVLRTDLHQLSLSLLEKHLLNNYPEIYRFSNCEHEQNGLKAYTSKNNVNCI